MEGSSVKDFTSSTPTKSQHIQNSGETNENDQMGSSNLQNPKKAAMKHFMSPTISAATKAAAVPRKKILAERNEAFTFANPHSQKPPILDSKTSPIISGTGRSVRSSDNSTYETDDDDDHEEQKIFDADSCLRKPYDPLTNYLSPRPKFLRYNPNRRNKIFLHGENEATERKDGVGGIKTSVSFDSQKAVGEETPSEEEGSVKEDEERMDKSEGNHNDDEEVEEIEEFEEETCWSLKGVLKFLLVLGTLILSTSYICSMNSPNPSPIQEAIWDFRDGSQKIQSNIYEVVTTNKFFDSGNLVIDGRGEETLMGLLAVNQRDMDDGFVEEEIVEEDDVDRGLVESTVGLGEMVEVQHEQCENVFNGGLESKLKVPDPKPGSETAASEVLCDGEVVGEVEGSSSQLRGSDFTANEGVSDQEMDKIMWEGSDQLQGFETEEKSETLQDAPIALENVATSIDLKFKDEQMESDEQIKSQKVTVGEGAGKEVVEEEMETVEDLMEVLVQWAMLEVVPLVVIYTIVAAALGFAYHRSRQKKSAIKEDSLPTEKPLDEAVAAAAVKICNVEKEKKLEKVESFASPSSSSIRSTKEASAEFSRHSQAPIVELLGELVIGEVSSSLRRRKMLDSEESNRDSVSTTEMMISRSKAPWVQIQEQPSQREVSNADSPSFGSFTAEKKKIVVKKEEGGKGEEASMVITTPVRRSSRIRSRGAMSP